MAMKPGWPWTETASNITWESKHRRERGRRKINKWKKSRYKNVFFPSQAAASRHRCEEAHMGSPGEFSTKSQQLFLFSLHHFCLYPYASHICCHFSAFLPSYFLLIHLPSLIAPCFSLISFFPFLKLSLCVVLHFFTPNMHLKKDLNTDWGWHEVSWVAGRPWTPDPPT